MEAKLASSTYDFYVAYPNEFMQVGHYLNIIEPSNKVTGFAYNTVRDTYGQVFRYSTASSEYPVSVSEYTKTFSSWLDQKRDATAERAALAAEQLKADAAAEKVRVAQQAATEADSNASDLKAAYDTQVAELESLESPDAASAGEAQKQLEEAQADLAKLEAENAELQATLTEKTKAADEADKNLQETKAAYDAANAELAAAEAASGGDEASKAGAKIVLDATRAANDADAAYTKAQAEADSAQKRLDEASDLSDAELGSVSSMVYSGIACEPKPSVTKSFEGDAYLLAEGDHYTYSYAENRSVGWAKVSVAGISTKGSGQTWGTSGAVSFEITASTADSLLVPDAKKANPATIKAAKSKTVKHSKLMGKSYSFKPIKVKNAVGDVTFANASKPKVKKVISVNSKSGKLTVKANAKKGTYKVKVKISIAGDNDFNPYSTKKTVKVSVK